MSQAQLTRVINWFALAIALTLLVLVGFHIYKKHFLATASGNDYLFDDLPTQSAAPLEADIQQIVQAHIMGEVPKVVAPKAVVAKPAPKPVAPKTKLDIQLTGVIDGATPESGFAMIEIKRGKTAVLAVGETIGDTGAVLHQVLPGEVLVDRDGQIESVKMKRSLLELSQQMPNDSLIDLMEGDVMATTNDSAAVSSNLARSSTLASNTQDQNVPLTRQQTKEQQIRAQQLQAAQAATQQANTADEASSSNSILEKLPIPVKLLRL